MPHCWICGKFLNQPAGHNLNRRNALGAKSGLMQKCIYPILDPDSSRTVERIGGGSPAHSTACHLSQRSSLCLAPGYSGCTWNVRGAKCDPRLWSLGQRWAYYRQRKLPFALSSRPACSCPPVGSPACRRGWELLLSPTWNKTCIPCQAFPHQTLPAHPRFCLHPSWNCWAKSSGHPALSSCWLAQSHEVLIAHFDFWINHFHCNNLIIPIKSFFSILTTSWDLAS